MTPARNRRWYTGGDSLDAEADKPSRQQFNLKTLLFNYLPCVAVFASILRPYRSFTPDIEDFMLASTVAFFWIGISLFLRRPD